MMACEDMLAEVKLCWSLKDQRIRADFIEVFEVMHGLSPVSLETFFELHLLVRTIMGHNWKLTKKTRNGTH